MFSINSSLPPPLPQLQSLQLCDTTYLPHLLVPSYQPKIIVPLSPVGPHGIIMYVWFILLLMDYSPYGTGIILDSWIFIITIPKMYRRVLIWKIPGKLLIEILLALALKCMWRTYQGIMIHIPCLCLELSGHNDTHTVFMLVTDLTACYSNWVIIMPITHSIGDYRVYWLMYQDNLFPRTHRRPQWVYLIELTRDPFLVSNKSNFLRSQIKPFRAYHLVGKKYIRPKQPTMGRNRTIQNNSANTGRHRPIQNDAANDGPA